MDTGRFEQSRGWLTKNLCPGGPGSTPCCPNESVASARVTCV